MLQVIFPLRFYKKTERITKLVSSLAGSIFNIFLTVILILAYFLLANIQNLLTNIQNFSLILGPFDNQHVTITTFSPNSRHATYLIKGVISNGFKAISCSFAGGDNINSDDSLSKVRLGDAETGAEIIHEIYMNEKEAA